jgi:hypothetical protein
MREEGASDAKVRPLSKVVSEPLSPSPFPASCEWEERIAGRKQHNFTPLVSELSIRVTNLVVMGRCMHARALTMLCCCGCMLASLLPRVVPSPLRRYQDDNN